MLNDAFLSIVEPHAARSKPGASKVLLVRARLEGHIERVFPGAVVERGKGTDYEFRALIDRRAVSEAMINRVHCIDYDNFKDSIAAKDQPYHDALMGVWSIMMRLQKRLLIKRLGRQTALDLHPEDVADGYGRGRNIRRIADDLDWNPNDRHNR